MKKFIFILSFLTIISLIYEIWYITTYENYHYKTLVESDKINVSDKELSFSLISYKANIDGISVSYDKEGFVIKKYEIDNLKKWINYITLKTKGYLNSEWNGWHSSEDYDNISKNYNSFILSSNKDLHQFNSNSGIWYSSISFISKNNTIKICIKELSELDKINNFFQSLPTANEINSLQKEIDKEIENNEIYETISIIASIPLIIVLGSLFLLLCGIGVIIFLYVINWALKGVEIIFIGVF